MTDSQQGPAGAAPISGRMRWWQRLVLAALMFGLIGVLSAAGLGISFALAASSAETQLAQDRDDVRRYAEQAAVALAAIDPRDVEETLDRWEKSATGPLLADLRRGRTAFAETIGEARRSTEARVLAAAVRDLDAGSGSATVLVSLDVTTTLVGRQGGGNGDVRTPQRLELTMSRAGEVWKASGVRVIGLRR